MVRENNGEVREEISKQLDRSVVKDWDYQLEFKKKRAEEAKLAEMAMAQREKQVRTQKLGACCLTKSLTKISCIGNKYGMALRSVTNHENNHEPGQILLKDGIEFC